MKKRRILGQTVPRRRFGLIHASLGVGLLALGASCGKTESEPSSPDGRGGEAGQAREDDDEQPTSSGGKRGSATAGSTGKGGTSGTGTIDDLGACGGPTAGGAAPPSYNCIPSDVLRPPSTAVGLDSDIADVRLAHDDAGNNYLGGAVYGNYGVRVLGEQLQPPGYLVVAKLDASGKKVWSKRFGSEDQGDSLVSLSPEPSGELLVGASLSNQGRDFDDPNDWGDHRLMLARFAGDGTELARLTYPAPYDATLSGAHRLGDQLFVWGQAHTPFELGHMGLGGRTNPNAYIVQVDGLGEAVAGIELSDEVILGLVVSSTGKLITLLRRLDDPEPSMRVAALTEDLSVAWQAPFESRWEHGGDSYRPDFVVWPQLALDGDTLLVASHFATQGSFRQASLLDRFLLADGSSSREVIFPDSTDTVVQALQVLPDHSLVLGGAARSGLKVGEQVLQSASGSGPFLMQLSPEGEPLWASMFCYDSDYGYGGDLRLGYAKGSLQALLIGAGVSQLGKPFGELSEPLLLGFELGAEPTNGDGGRPTP